MELFLLMSIGISVVAFISISLNQTPPQASTDQIVEPAFPLESSISNSEKRNILKLHDETIQSDFDQQESQTAQTNMPEAAPSIQVAQAVY